MSALTHAQARAAHPQKEYAVKTRGRKAANKGRGAAKKEEEDVIELD